MYVLIHKLSRLDFTCPIVSFYRTMWYHQIRKFCPQTPIILVGCKNDTRFIYKDEQYLRYCKERSPLVR